MPAGPAAPPEAVALPTGDLDRRLYALAVDRLVAYALFAGAGYLAWVLCWHGGHVLAGVGVLAAGVLLVSVGFAVALGLAGLSPGKALTGLRVVREDDGRPIGVGAALVRTAVLGVATLPTLGLGLATLAWTALADPGGRRRGAHDRLGRCMVVDVRPVPVVPVEPEATARPIVNLTAMRLVPPAPARAATPVPAPEPLPAPVLPPAPVPPTPPIPPAPPPTSTAPGVALPVGSAWTVSFDTGESFRVEGLALVGRGPEARAGEPVRHLVPLRSVDMSLSKTHAQFQVVPDGALVIMDRGSTNGSFVLRGGVSRPLTAGRPTTLLDGDTVRLGDRTMSVTRG